MALPRPAAPPRSESDEQAVRDLLLLAREHPLAFARVVKPGYSPQRFHRDIAAALKRVEAGELRRLIINVPPRYGKSELASVDFPAWLLGRHPDHRVIQTSYSTELARAFGRRARNIVGTPEYRALFPGIRVAQDTKAADVWNIQGTDGGYIAAGVGAGITGHGGDVCIIDDPFKDRQEANSRDARDKVWSWYTDVLKTRLQGIGAIILIQTRWHEDDLAGRLLVEDATCSVCQHVTTPTSPHPASAGHAFKQLGDGWTVITLPALTELDDGSFRALWPARHTVDELLKLRAQNPRTFAALYQQSPTAEQGSVFQREWFTRRYTSLPTEHFWLFQSADTAFKTGVGNDYSVIATWGTDGLDYYLVHVWRGRVEYPDLRLRALDLAARFRPRALLVEDAASGQSVIQDLRRNTPLPVIPISGMGSKESSTDAITPVFESQRVLLPESAPWLDEWIEEHVAFPNGTHDDQVRTTDIALNWAANRKPQPRQMMELTTTGQPKTAYASYWRKKHPGRTLSAPERPAMPRVR